MGNTIWDTVKRNVGIATIVIYLIIIIILISYNEQYKMNEHMVNKTVDNNTIQVAELYYAKDSYVPVRVFGKPQDNHFGSNPTFLIIFLLVLNIILNYKKMTLSLIPESLAKKFVKERILQNKDIESSFVYEETYLREVQFSEEPPKPFARVVFSELHYKDDKETHDKDIVTAWVLDPYTNYIKNIENRKGWEPTIEDTCPKCGSYYNMKIVTPQLYKKIMEDMGLRGKKRI